MHEYKLLAVFDRVEVHVRDAVEFGGEFGQFEVMRREQRERVVRRRERHRARPCEGQTVVGRGAAANLVHQHEARRGRVVQDVRRLAHLDHEGRVTAGEIVASANTREDTVDRADARAVCGHETANVGEQHDQRGLAHVRRFAAHVRAGDDQHAASAVISIAVQQQIVRLERIGTHLFDDRMAAAHDMDTAHVDKLWSVPAQRIGAFGEVRQHVEFGDRGRGGL